MSARIAVVIPCFNDGEYLEQAVFSVDEQEPVELVIVDDGSEDPNTVDTLERLEAGGYQVVRHPENRGVSAARMTGLVATSAPYVFPLDADDLAVSGALGRMADRLDATGEAVACYGDYVEFRISELIRAVPPTLDPYRLAFTNEYPVSPLMRRSAIEAAGGWQPLTDDLDAQSDWSLWMALAKGGATGTSLGPGELTYLRRMHPGRLARRGRARRRMLYDRLRERHSELFARLGEYRQRSTMRRGRRLLYPLVYGRRPRLPGEDGGKALLDRIGVWTLTREQRLPQHLQISAAFAAARHRRPAVPPGDSPRIAVIVPCFNDGPFVEQAVLSVAEPEPVELVVVDDGSTEPANAEALDRLEAAGYQVIRHPENRGVSAARMTGLAATSAPYVFPLDADDLAIPGVLSRMADRLDRSDDLTACFGDYVEFRISELIRAVPPALDPYRLAFTNEYPQLSLYRRASLEQVGGWSTAETHEDWDLWLSFAERDLGAVRAPDDLVTARRRMVPGRRGAGLRRRHPTAYRVLRDRHREFFDRLAEYRRRSQMPRLRKALYPFVYGGRRRLRVEPALKAMLDRYGVWTLRR